MIFFLCNFLASLGFKIPSFITYGSNRMMLATLTSLFFTLCFGAKFIQKLYEMKIGQPIRTEDCPVLAQLHEKKKDTPTMGGVLILSSMLFSLLLWMDLKSSFTLILLITTIWLGLLGGYDDYLKLKFKNSKGLGSKKKLIFQVTLGCLVGLYTLVPAISEKVQCRDWFTPPFAKEFIDKSQLLQQTPLVKDTETVGTIVKGEKSWKLFRGQKLSQEEYMGRYYIPFFKRPIFILSGPFLILSFLIINFIVTGSSNAVNLTDGLDGLASGSAIMVSFVLALVAFVSSNMELSRYLHLLYIEGSEEIGVYLFAMIGACLGFLWFNGFPAQVFMGDTGSLSLGGILGVCAILLRKEVLLGLVGGIFVAEALSVIIQVLSYKLRNKKRVFLCAPLHHHFEYKGWPETKVVLRFWIVGLILAFIGLISLGFQ